VSDVPATLRFDPNVFEVGELVQVRVEHVPQRVIDEEQTCTLAVVEVDERGANPRRVAEFKVRLTGGLDGQPIRFAWAERITQAGEATDDHRIGKSPDEVRAPTHIVLALHGLPEQHTVLVSLPETEDEGDAFELSLTLSDASGTELYPAGQPAPFACLPFRPRSREFRVFLWSKLGENGAPLWGAQTMERIRGYAQQIFEKNGIDWLQWRVVGAAEGERRMQTYRGLNDAFIRVAEARTSRTSGGGGTGESKPDTSTAGLGKIDPATWDAWVHPCTTADPPGSDNDYRTGWTAAHEVLHQYLERTFAVLFARQLVPNHEDHEDPKAVPWQWTPENPKRPVLYHLNTAGTIRGMYDMVPTGPSPKLRAGEEILYRQRCLLLTLHELVRDGRLDEWVQRFYPYRDAFEWRSLYEPGGRVRTVGLTAKPLPLWETLAPLEEAGHRLLQQARSNLLQAEILYLEGKRPWYRNDDEDKFAEAKQLLEAIAAPTGVELSPALVERRDELLAKVKEELR